MSSNRGEIVKEVLKVLGIAGFIAISLALPGLPAAISPFLKRYKPHQVRRSIKGLVNRGMVTMRQVGDKTEIRLTKEGKEKLLKFKLEAIEIKKPKKWDKKWRLVIFDIPEKYKLGRDTLVKKLKELGFKQLQKSVLVHPYECEDEVDFITEMYEIYPFVRVVEASKIDRHSDLLEYFGLT